MFLVIASLEKLVAKTNNRCRNRRKFSVAQKKIGGNMGKLQDLKNGYGGNIEVEELFERKPCRRKNSLRRAVRHPASGCLSCGSFVAISVRAGLRVCEDCLDESSLGAAALSN